MYVIIYFRYKTICVPTFNIFKKRHEMKMNGIERVTKSSKVNLYEIACSIAEIVIMRKNATPIYYNADYT